MILLYLYLTERKCEKMRKEKAKQLAKTVLVVLIAVSVFVGMTPLIGDGYQAEAATKAAISKTKVTMYVGTSYTLKMVGAKGKVKWSTGSKKVAKVSSKGKVTAKKAGSTTIKAKVGKKTYKCKVSVKKVPKLSKTSTSIYVGKSTTLKLSGTKIGATTWSTSNKKIATVNNSGKVVGVKKGTAYIYAKIGGKTLKCKVTVKAVPIVPVKYIFMKPVISSIYVGQTLKYDKPTVSPSNATYTTPKWSSSNPKIATVDQNGVAKGVSAGSVDIIVEIGGKKESALLFVDPEKVVLNVDKSELYVGETVQMKASIDPGVVPGKVITWRSADPSVATVDQNGLVTAVSKGSVNIYAGVDGRENGKSIKVKAPKVELDDYTLSLYEGDTYTEGYYIEQGDFKNPCEWTSDNEDVATVDQNGNITAVSSGKAKITLTCAGGSDYMYVTVKKLTATSISIAQSSVNMMIGDTEALAVTVKPEQYPVSSLEWTSSNESVATVENGVVTAHSKGTAYIYAKADGKSDYCIVKVSGIDVTSLTFDDTSATLYEGEQFKINATISPSNATAQDITWKSSNTRIATVEDGVVTAHEEGRTTITGVVGGKSATCSVTVIGKTVTLGKGETWTVEDNWRFTINSVKVHEKCSLLESENNKGEQVVSINYTYYNDGYVSSSGSGLMISTYQMKVYDQNGEVGQRYICMDEVVPKTIDVGKSCTAEQTIILPNESEDIQIVLDVKDNNFKSQKAAFNVSVSQPIDVIVDYINENGKTDSNDHKYITPTDPNFNAKVIYYEESNELCFWDYSQTKEMATAASIYYDIDTETVRKVQADIVNFPLNYSFSAEASMNAATYKYNGTLAFKQTFGKLPEYVTANDLYKTCNLIANTTMTGAELTLFENTGYCLKDIGFNSFAVPY